MSLVKWIRKNNRKIMVFVVIFSMIAFVIGSYGLQIIGSFVGGGNRVIGTYDDGSKIRQNDFMTASNQLTVLKSLMADRYLLMSGGQSLAGPLVTKLIFPDSQVAGDIAGQLKQAVQQGQLQITSEQLDDYFNQPVERAEIMWLLLRAEAYNAGCITSPEYAKQMLRSFVPPATQNTMDAKQLVDRIITQSNITEEQIIRVFADLMSVMEYANMVINSLPVTTNEVKATIGRNKERIDAEFVKIAAESLIDKDAAISDAAIQEQFDAYKDVAAGEPSENNPFGFGYKLPKRVQLEYMIIKMDDVKTQTTKVTADEMESYYSRNLSRFQSEEPSDPDNPESEKKTVTRSFAEVENSIRQSLENEKSQTLANLFFSEARDLTDTKFSDLNMEEATVGDLQIKAGDFEAVAKQVSTKYSIPVSVGKTGLVDTDAFGQGTVLGSLAMPYQRNYVRLSDLAFAVTEEASKRRRIGMPSYRVWQTIGPVSGGYYDEENRKYYRLMGIVRVVDIADESVADSVDVTYDTKGIVMFDSQKSEDTTVSVKELVKDDLQILAAMKTAEQRAGELAKLVDEKGWDEAVKAYNEKYAKDNADAKIKLDTVKQQLRVSQTDIEMAKRLMQSNPAYVSRLKPQLKSNMLTNKLYAMLPEDQETTGTIEKTLAFEPGASCYVVKEVIRKPATTKDYADDKSRTALQLGGGAAMELPLVHFSTENILQRMNYKPKLDRTQEADKTETDETEKKDEAA